MWATLLGALPAWLGCKDANPHHMTLGRLLRVVLTLTWLAIGFGCVRTTYVCEPPAPRDLMPEILALVGPPHLVPDSTVPSDRLVGRVYSQFQRAPIRNARVQLDASDARTTTGSAGVFALPTPDHEHAVLRISAIGYLTRRDSLPLPLPLGHRLEFLLPDATALGDIEAMPCTPRRHRWPFG